MSVRDTIRANRIQVVPFELSSGQRIFVRAFSGPARAAYSEYLESSKENGGIKSHVVAAMAICEEDGTLAYDWTNAEHVQEIAEHIDASDLDNVGLKLFEISGLTRKAIEEAEKK